MYASHFWFLPSMITEDVHMAGAVYNSATMIIEILQFMCHGSLCHDMNNNISWYEILIW